MAKLQPIGGFKGATPGLKETESHQIITAPYSYEFTALNKQKQTQSLVLAAVA